MPSVLMRFGKYKGKPISTVEIEYLQWMVKNDTFQKDDAEAEIYRRETGGRAEVEKEGSITPKAIDMASVSLHHLWLPTNQGVFTWLLDIFTEALNKAPMDVQKLPAGEHHLNYRGIRFVIDGDLQLIDVYPLEESLNA
jgi:hypothetical protein